MVVQKDTWLEPRVALIGRKTLFRVRGGDTTQVVQTARHLKYMGVRADIKLADEPIEYDRYDLLHFFNLTRPADILCHIRRSGLPCVVSTILVDYGTYDQYPTQSADRLLFRLFPGDRGIYLKTILRWAIGRDALPSKSYLWRGQRGSMLKVLRQCDMVLPNSRSELNRLIDQYHYQGPAAVVPNGIDTGLFRPDPSRIRDPFLVLCVGRIEGIKNQINLIRALNHSPFRVLLIGDPAPSQPGYYAHCRRIAAPNIEFIGQLPQRKLLDYYSRAGIHILPSWFETTGLSSLEAGVMGCKVIISDRGDAPEYFRDLAIYCDPGSPESIRTAVERATAAPYDDLLRDKILDKYTWEKATVQTVYAYSKAMIGFETQHGSMNFIKR